MKIRSLILCLLLFQNLLAQQSGTTASESWYLKDAKIDRVQGISVEKTYTKLLKNKPSKTILVAVIDSGVDIDHEDLKDNVWINTGEIAGNGIDDDNNGYVDDIHGWNFLGGKNGNVTFAPLELSRIYRDLKSKYEIDSAARDTTTTEYKLWKDVSKKYIVERDFNLDQYGYYQMLQKNFQWYSLLMKSKLKTDSLTIEKIEAFVPMDSTANKGKRFMMLVNDYYGSIDGFDDYIDYFKSEVNKYDIESDVRSIVGDDPKNLYEKGYGNNDVEGPDARHGTHVSGIIAAVRDNHLGINGIANNVKIMPIRAVPDGDERDKDIANAILYAVDNGAQIINMSFGKPYSPQKEAVDKAVRYAEEKGVLMVHGAGNESLDIDTHDSFPTRKLANGKSVNNWLEVGASSRSDNHHLVAEFSNFGQKEVDVFAPGVDIYSTTPDNTYESLDGTSMAAPVVSGAAALIMSYYPTLSAVQVIDIIKKTAKTYPKLMVITPGTENDETLFSDLSSSGGVVNVYKAMKMAEKVSRKQKE
ncbi:MAG TPA: S8 family peptidase [Fulvivirga sp.]|nr:S8 family peptidase [Fulvivirga sp.]